MRRPRSKLQVSTFPFLAVLLCAMGSLLLFLFIMDRRAKIAARNHAMEASAAAKALRKKDTPEELDTRQAEWEQAKEKLRQLLVEEEQQVLAESKGIQDHLADGTRKLDILETQYLNVQQQINSEAAKLLAIQVQIDQYRNGIRSTDKKEAASKAELDKATHDLIDLTNALKFLRQQRERDKEVYSVVPYRGKRGDMRQPIYLDCVRDGIVFQPEKTVLHVLSFTPAALIAELERRTGPLAVEKPLKDKERGRLLPQERKCPYILFLIRPEGISNYYRAQAALRGLELDFGYELVDDNWQLDFSGQTAANQPAPPVPVAGGVPGFGLGSGTPGTGNGNPATGGNPGPGGSGPGGLPSIGAPPPLGGVPGVGSGPSYGNRPPATLGVPGVGSGPSYGSGPPPIGGQGVGSAPGYGNGPPPIGGQGPGIGSGSGVGSGLPSSGGVPAIGSGSGYGNGPPAIGGQGPGIGSGPGVGSGLPSSGGVPGIGVSSGYGSGPPSTGVPGLGNGIPGTGAGPPLSSAVPSFSGSPSGTGVPGNGTGREPSFVPLSKVVPNTGLEPIASAGVPGYAGSASSQKVVPNTGLEPIASAGVPGYAGSASSQQGANAGNISAIGTPIPGNSVASQRPNQGSGNATVASSGSATSEPGTQGSSTPGNSGAPGTGTPGSSGTPGTGTPGNPGAPDGSATAGGGPAGSGTAGSGEPGMSFSKFPLPPASGSQTSSKPVAASSISKILGNKDFLITIDCYADHVTAFPGGMQFRLTTQNMEAENQALLRSIAKLIERRQASVRPGEPPYRPLIRLQVSAEGLRSYYRVYPILEQLRIPPQNITRENVED